jgi:hypothetical protein
MTKLYPALLAPLFFIYQWRRGGLRSILSSVFTFLVVLEGISIPLLILDAGGFISSFTIQSGRALQLESLYSSLLLLGQSLGIISAQPVQGPISLDIVSPLAEHWENACSCLWEQDCWRFTVYIGVIAARVLSPPLLPHRPHRSLPLCLTTPLLR